MQLLAHGAPLQVLLLEDDPVIARALSRSLRQAGHTVTVVERCQRARELRQEFDVAVLDLELPDGPSLDLADELLGLGSARAVLFFSGASDPLLLNRAARIGEVVSKSAPFEELLQAIEATRRGPTSEFRALRTAPQHPRIARR